MAKFLKENFDKKETFDFAKQRKPFQVQFGLKKHVKNTGIYRYSDGGISVFAISIHSMASYEGALLPTLLCSLQRYYPNITII
jgi:hypothetical protein